jgi:transposase
MSNSSRTRRAPPLVLSDEQRREIESIAQDEASPTRAARQARALLLAAQGVSAAEVGRRCGVTAETVRRWRRSLERCGTSFIGRIAPGRGRKPVFSAEKVELIVHDTLHVPPSDAPAWSTRAMARRHGVSKDTVARIWRQHDIAPSRRRGEGSPMLDA